MHSAPPPSSLQACLDQEAIQRLRELDPSGASQLLARLVKAFSASLDRLLPELAAARRAVPPDLSAVRQVCHTLKSSSASLGAMQLSQRCAAIEAQARDGEVADLQAQLDALQLDIDQAKSALAALI